MRSLITLLAFLLIAPALLAQNEINPPDDINAVEESTHLLGLENAAVSIRWLGGEYLSPETDGVERNYVSLESFDESAGEDVRVDVWGIVEAALNIWVFVHDRAANKWWAYGRANREATGSWVAHGVQFGEGIYQGRRFTIRAAVMRRSPTKPFLDAAEWQRDALAISDPVYVSISKRLIKPFAMPNNVKQTQVWLSTVNHTTVTPTETIVVEPTAEISGTYISPADSTTSSNNEFIYVMVRSATADRWRVFGPAVKNGVKWEVQNVEIADPGEPQWTRFKISAVITDRRFKEKSVSYEDWWKIKKATSEPAEVSVKPLVASVERPNPALSIGYIQTLIDTQSVAAAEQTILDSLQEVLQIGGTLQRPGQGTSVWVLINPVGSDLWEVHGPAILSSDGWRLPLIHSQRLRQMQTSTFRLVAVASTTTLPRGMIRYAEWRNQTLAISEGMTLVEQKPSTFRTSRLALSIQEIEEHKVDEKLALPPNDRAAVSGSVNSRSGNNYIWVGTRKNASDTWQFSGPALMDKKSWKVPNVFFSDLPDDESAIPAEAVYDVVAIATSDPLPSLKLSGSELPRYALATSPVIRVEHVTASILQLAGLRANAHWLIWGLILLGLAVLLEFYFRSISHMLDSLTDATGELSDYLATQFDEMPKPKIIPSAFGVIISLLGVYAIVGYFPIYVHVLETVLNLTREESESLALLLIIFIGLAGVIIHLSLDFISDRKSEHFLTKIFDYALNYALPITVLVVTLALWGVQALLYLEMYLNQVEPGNTRIPAAMGAVAFFIAGIETLGFYWATRLGKDFFSWLFFHLFILGPPAIANRLLGVLRTFFLAFPSREALKQRREAEAVNSDLLS
ncbi:MAG: hypothetical protein ACRBF0_07865 [Calditrichia bacterium]